MKKIIIIFCIVLFSSINAMEDPLSDNAKKVSLTAILTLKRPVTLNHPDKAISARYNNAATRLITTAKDGLVRLWDAKSGEMQCQLIPEGHPLFRPHFTSADFSPKGEHLVLPTDNEITFVYDTHTGQTISTLKRPWAKRFFPDPVNSAAYTRKGRYIVTTQSDGIYIWDPRIAKMALHYRPPKHRSSDNRTILSADSNEAETHVVAASSGTITYLYDIRSPTDEYIELDNGSAYERPTYQESDPSPGFVPLVKFHPQEDTLFTAFKKGILLWNISGELQAIYDCPAPITSLAINGQYLAGSYEKELQLLDQTTETSFIFRFDHPINSLTFDRSGDMLVATSGRQAIAWKIDITT